MSGIAGVVHFDGRPVLAADLHRMTEAMACRGPDGIHHGVNGSVGLGHCALHATGEAVTERQPVRDASSQTVIVFSGRLDNRSELARQLRMAATAGGCGAGDAELVLRAYDRWGTACASHLDGDFAFSIWDERRRRLFCARDAMGHKPFHYHWNGRTLVFASDVHAVLRMPWVADTLNEGFLAELLSTELLSVDETLWQGVHRLPAAHALLVDASGPTTQEYWSPDLGAALPCRTDADFTEYHRELLFDVVRQASRSQHPVSFEVSGGLDSSALFAVGHQLHAAGRLLAPDLHGYALSFRDPYADESSHRQALEAHIGRKVQEVAPAASSVAACRDFAASNKAFLGFPNGTMMGSLYEEGRRAGSRVMVGGIGGDEWLQTMQDWRCTAFVDRDWRMLARWVRQQGTSMPLAAYGLLRHGLLPLLPDSVKMVLRPLRREDSARSWLANDLRRLLATRKEEHSARFGRQRVSRIHDAQLAQWRDPWHVMVKEFNERHAAQFGMERRDPFWSRRVVQAAFATPERLRGREAQSKWLHKQAMCGVLPAAILQREDKADFFVVFQAHHEELRRAVADLGVARSRWVSAGRHSLLRNDRADEERSIMGDLAAWSLVMIDAMAGSAAAPSGPRGAAPTESQC